MQHHGTSSVQPRGPGHAMTHIDDLPLSCLDLIITHAHGRHFIGTNRYACVSRRWRDASSMEEAELLELYIDLRHMSDADVTRAFSWMATHGQHVKGLVLQGSMARKVPWDLFARAVPFNLLTNLTWLEVIQRHSLVRLTPILGQLPQLKHLAAAVDLGYTCQGDLPEDEGVMPSKFVGFCEDGSLTDDWEVPIMQQLCPQLTSLHLGLVCCEDMMLIDGRLARLLPSRLQRLTLESGWCGQCALLHPSSLTHITGLQQLNLNAVQLNLNPVDLVEGAAGAWAPQQGLPQQLRVLFCGGGQHDPLLQLAPILTGYFHWHHSLGIVPHLVRLSKLMFLWDYFLPEGTAAAMAALTGLQELTLDGPLEEDMADVLQQVAGMASLRSLWLEGEVAESLELSTGLAQCTQLTALTLLVSAEWSAARAAGYTSMLQQLTGLCSLVVPGALMRHAEGAWLAPLSHLTCLLVQLPPSRIGQPQYAVVEGPVWLVRGWPAILEQVLGAASEGERLRPPLWQFTPAVPDAALVQV